jgi:hypothetical protein
MATDKKHIAVYLDSAVEQALIAFCEQKGLKSKKGTMFSAGVNAALSEFFGISDIEESNTPQEMGNTPPNSSNIPPNSSNTPQEMGNIPPNSNNTPTSADDTILPHVSNIPAKSLAVEVMPGKLHLTESNAESLRQEVEELKADRARLLESSTDIIKKIRQEFQSQLKTEHTAREQVEAELAELKQNSTTANRNLPEAAHLLNQLKARRKKSKADLVDLETILEILEDGGEKTLQQALDKRAGKHDR